MSGTTTWDPNNKSASITLTGSNLVATATGVTTNQGVRATRQVVGPIYMEHAVTLVSTSYRLGLCNLLFAPASVVLGVDTNGIGYGQDGTVKINNVTLATIATYTTGNNVDIAYHPQFRLFWARVNNGNWNNNVANNPASATLTDTQGGISTATLVTFQLLPAFQTSGTSNAAVTSKFSTAFTRTPPTGFVSVDADPGAICKPCVITVGPNSGTLCLGPIAGTAVGGTDTKLINYEPVIGEHSNTPSNWTKAWSPAAAATYASGIVSGPGGTYLAKKVRLYDQNTGEFLGETTSLLADGTWSIPALGRTSVYAVCLDDTGTYNSLVFDLVVPL